MKVNTEGEEEQMMLDTNHECWIGPVNSLLIPCTDFQYRLFHSKPLQLLYHRHEVIAYRILKENSQVMVTEATNLISEERKRVYKPVKH